MRIEQVPINKVKPDPNQPRKTFDQERIKEMAQNILTEGVINPIEVDEKHVIITGEMRWRSAKEAGLKEVPCKMLKIEPDMRFRRQVSENLHHNTMSDWDTAKALQKLLAWVTATRAKDKFNPHTDKGYRELGRMLGKGHKFISRYMDLLEAPKEIQKAVRDNKIGYSLIAEIKAAPKEFQQRLMDKVMSGELAVRDGARVLAKALQKHPEKADELLELNYTNGTYFDMINTVNKIVPSLSKQLQEAYDPIKELAGINNNLQKWLKQNHPHSLGKLFGSRVVMTFGAMEEAINEWLKEGKNINTGQSQLKGK